MYKKNLDSLVVLLVEDHDDASTTVQLMLKKMGITHVLKASNGNDALLQYGKANKQLDMILCDWNMPHMSGIELLHHVRRADENIPFIMITARGDLASIEEAKAAKVSGYILKPFSLEEMRKKIHAFL